MPHDMSVAQHSMGLHVSKALDAALACEVVWGVFRFVYRKPSLVKFCKYLSCAVSLSDCSEPLNSGTRTPHE